MKIEIEKNPRRERYAYGRRSIVSPLSPHAGIQTVIECDYDPQGWIFEEEVTVSGPLVSPAMGRWLSRDPIEEQGGLNLYAFVLNMPIFNIDIRGNIPDGWYVPERKLPEIPPLAYLLPWQIIPILPTGDGDWLTPVFDQRMPGTVNHMRQSFSDIIGRKIGENCGKPGSEAVHPIAPKATTIENVENYGDKPAEFWESAFALGKFSFDVENTTITYSPLECGKLRYEWTADMYVLDVLGLWNWPLARLAHWVISGSGECCPLKDS